MQANYCASIEAGLALLQTSDAALKNTVEPTKIRQLENWQAMALRDGAITIYNFYMSLLAVEQNLKGCYKIISLLNRTEKRMAKRLFESYFPRCIDMRHAVAHSAELYATPEQLKRNAGDWMNRTIGHSYHTSINGKAIAYDLTARTHKKLEDIASLMWAAFQPLVREHNFQA